MILSNVTTGPGGWILDAGKGMAITGRMGEPRIPLPPFSG